MNYEDIITVLKWEDKCDKEDNMSDISKEKGQILYWNPVTEDTELKEHYWYLLATTKYGTAVKAKFHSDGVRYFEILTQDDESEYVYSWEWEGYITHYMEMPKLPWEI